MVELISRIDSYSLAGLTGSGIFEFFKKLPVDETWTFEGTSRTETSYITHSYHRYPAKFIPQLASRLIREYSSSEGDLICDPFMGCGTTLVESMMLKRRSVGVDVNPTAFIATKAKTTPIRPEYLRAEVDKLQRKAKPILKDRASFLERDVKPVIPPYKRIDYWFTETSKQDLGMLLALIEDTLDEDVRAFLQCGFSHILKNCSRWMMRSVKPTIDQEKTIPDVHDTFFCHIRKMVNKNERFWNALPAEVRENPKSYVRSELRDCRNLPIEKNQVAAIVTSSPYVTSYEYADLNQLTALWFECSGTLQTLRKDFIGSSQTKVVDVQLKSGIAQSIVEKYEALGLLKISLEVSTYFAEMQQAFAEFQRVLQPEGVACFVIGNTALKGVEILNGEVFLETCLSLGFKPVRVVKRRIPSGGKILPSIRDTKTGRFTSADNGNGLKEAYSYEYIVIVQKQGDH